MFPILYESNNIVRTLGKGALSDAISCVIREELNGEFSLTLEYPITGPLYSELINGGTIAAVLPIQADTDLRFGELRNAWFDIYKHDLPIDGVVTFYANHVSRRLANSTIQGRSISRTASEDLVQYATPADWNGIEMRISEEYITTGPSYYVINEPRSVLAACISDEDSYATTYGMEAIYADEFTVVPPYQPVCQLTFLKHRGTDRGASVHYGANLLDLQHTQDSTGTFNAVVPYWDDGAGNITYASGYVVQPTTPITPVVAVPLNCTDAFQTQPTSAQLVTFAQSYLDTNTPWVGEETITVDFVNGIEIIPHSAPVVLGDTVHVYWGGADVAVDLRCVAYEYDSLSERYSKLELGTQEKSFVAITGIDAVGGEDNGGSSPSPPAGSPFMELLWTNPSPGSSFAAQTVPLDLSDCDMVAIVLNRGTSDTTRNTTLVWSGDTSKCVVYQNAYGLYPTSRNATVSSTGVAFSGGYDNGNSTASTPSNVVAIPYKIYGIKGVIIS